MNDSERDDFVINDEGLYDLMRRSKMSRKKWVKENRKLIDEVIENIASRKKSQSYLKYG